MAQQLAFYFEQNHCVGCDTCQIACKGKHNLPVGQLFRKVYEVSGGAFRERDGAIIPEVYAFWISISCNHCVRPKCIESCPAGAIQKRPLDGIVHIVQDQCIGCRRCLKACPYGSPQYNPFTRKVGKCDFCLDLISQNKPPACVSSCPMRALDYGPLDELQKKLGSVNSTKGLPRADTEPALVITPHRHAVDK